jgi:hypothetical protein
MKKRELLLHNIAARFIVGENIDLELEGNPKELHSLYELLLVSRELKKSLDEGKDIDKISKLLEEKKIKTREFQEVSNIVWRL